MSDYQPLKISCQPFNAISTDGYLPLGSILAHVWMREHYPELLYGNSVGAKDDLIEAELPILRLGNGDDWYYACSFVQAEWKSGDIKYWHKRNTASEQIRYIGTGKINVAQGKTKAYRMPLFTLEAEGRLEWFLVADKAWLAPRLPLVTAIGKKRVQGNGVVVDWQIEEISDDWSVWRGGQLMRSIPLVDIPPEKPSNFRVGSYALRPPYWHPNNQYEALALPILKGAGDATG